MAAVWRMDCKGVRIESGKWIIGFFQGQDNDVQGRQQAML